MRSLLFIMAVLAVPAYVSAAVAPILISGYNQDIIVDNTATQGTDLRPTITATMDAGTGLTGGTYYQTGFVTASPTTGLPAGTVVTSATGNGTFQLRAHNVSNAFLLNNTTSTATITLTTPAAYSQLAFYDATGAGTGSINYTINFVGGGTEGGSFTSGDWFNATPVAYTAAGRANNVVTGTTDNVGTSNPRVYEHLLSVTNTSTNIQSISLSRATAAGNTVILALSGNLVPEPASLGLLVTASLGLLIRRRRS